MRNGSALLLIPAIGRQIRSDAFQFPADEKDHTTETACTEYSLQAREGRAATRPVLALGSVPRNARMQCSLGSGHLVQTVLDSN